MKTCSLLIIVCHALVGQAFAAKIIPDFPNADLALGQTDFDTGETPSVQSSFTLNRPEGLVIDPVSGKMFVADYNNNRILRYPSIDSLSTGAGAEAVFGQARFSDTSSGNGDLRLNGPIGLYFDRHGRLWVADSGNNRVLMFEAAVYRGDQPYPDRVFGQSNFSSNGSGTSSNEMNTPYGVWVDDADRLWVADQGNSRVLRFDSVSNKANGASADGVLGQVNFGNNSGATTGNGMRAPNSVTVSGQGTLFVADTDNNRVLRFDNAASLSNGAGASAVLGQTNFTSSNSGLSATTMDHPTGVLITPNDTLWVSERGNNRLTRFDKASKKPTGSPANGVVGQPDLNTRTIPVVAAIGAINGSISQGFVDSAGNLWIADTDNNRALRFPPDTRKPTLAVTSKVPKSTSKKKITIKGTAKDDFGISKVLYQVNNGRMKTAKGKKKWKFTTKLGTGKNKITLQVIDLAGNKSAKKVLKVKRIP